MTTTGERLDVLVAMYVGVPEPPTLNALAVIAGRGLALAMLRGNLSFDRAGYLAPLETLDVGREIDIRASERRPVLHKAARFAQFVVALLRALRERRPKILLLHDHLSLYAWSLIARVSGFRGVVWHNSYDAIDVERAPPGRFSLLGRLHANYAHAFATLDLFSLPSAERLPFYPTQALRGETHVVPNFPARLLYADWPQARAPAPGVPLELIYQGALGPGHGFVELLDLICEPIDGRDLRLSLKGWVRPEFRAEIDAAAHARGVSQRLTWKGYGPYRSVPEAASSCHVGLAIFTATDIMNRTLATASNKLYEYAALGLPVLMYRAPHFVEALSRFRWIRFTDLSPGSLREELRAIVADWPALSAAASADFARELNFERVFEPVLDRALAIADARARA